MPPLSAVQNYYRKMIRLTTVSNSIDANLLQHRLASEGIKSFLTNENISTLLPHLNGILGHGIQIMVSETEYEKAKEILIAKQNEDQILKCPHCGSLNIGFGMRGKNRIGDQFLIILSMIIALPMGNIKNKYYCKDCKEVFV